MRRTDGATGDRRTRLSPRDATTLRWFGTAAIASLGLIAGGYLLGNGLLRAKGCRARGYRARSGRARCDRRSRHGGRSPIPPPPPALARSSGQGAPGRTQAIPEGFFFPGSRVSRRCAPADRPPANVSSFTNEGVTTLHRAPAARASLRGHLSARRRRSRGSSILSTEGCSSKKARA